MKRFCISSGLVLLFFFFAQALVRADGADATQATPVVVRALGPAAGWPISLDQFKGVPPDITLVPHGEGARRGQLWVRTARPSPTSAFFGLYIAGKVDGPQPDFPLTRDLVPSKDHIEIWLAGSRDVKLPPIGWSNQFQQIVLPQGAESCEDWAYNDQIEGVQEGEKVKECREWAESQEHYREYFKRLFMRQWLLAPRQEIELSATPAFEHITDWFADDQLDQFMKPQGQLEFFLVFPETSGYSFEVLIPFEHFPPLPKLDTSELYLLVDIFNAAPPGKDRGAYSTSSPRRVVGKPDTFNFLRLDPPFSFPLTFCKLPLGESPEERNEHLTWVLPTTVTSYGDGSAVLWDSFVIENTWSCGAWLPSGLSPWVRKTHHFDMGMRTGPWVCGPNLSVAKAGKSESFPDVIAEQGLDYKQLQDGHLLIKIGPRFWSYADSGACFQGAGYPITDLRIYDLTQDMVLHKALALSSNIDGMRLKSQDFTISPDWSQITQYDDWVTDVDADSWSSTTWCLKPKTQNQPGGHVYEKCGEKENVVPPNPPVLKKLRQ